MAYKSQQLSKGLIEEILEYLMVIDGDTIGERWNKSHFDADLPGKWDCSWVITGNEGPAAFVVASDKTEAVHVHRIAVAPSVRGQGLGRVLLALVAQSAKERGIDSVTLRVSADNEGAIKFYQRLGFSVEDPAVQLLNLSAPVNTLLPNMWEPNGAQPLSGGKAKVLFVCTADITAAKLLAPQMRALKRAGFDVHIACADGPYVKSLLQDGFPVRPIKIMNRASPFVNLASVFALYRLMRAEKYKIVHVHMISAGVLGRVAAGLARVPLVFYTFRGFAFYEGSSLMLRLFNIVLEKACTPVTDFFFSQSEANLRRAIRHGVIPVGRSMVLGNGIALDEFIRDGAENRSEASPRVRKELNISSDAPVIGFVGRLVREKGVFELIEASADVLAIEPTAVFLMVGDALPTDKTARDEISRRLRQLNIESDFVFTGWRGDVSRLYQAMDLFVLPSYREGMPRSIMEAMASRLPVIATDIAGCQDEVIDGVTGVLVPPQDSVALAKAIVRLISDRALAQRMGQAGQERAALLFDERVVCERLVCRYEELTREAFQTAGAKRVSFFLKGIIDYTAAALGLVLLLPLFLLIALAIKIDSKGPVLYRQTREGRDGHPFKIFKFRTMEVGADRRGLEIRKDDDRITRVGRLLRVLSLDELPQLINILQGEMSLVGPRPLLPGTTRIEERRRLSMKPGITSYPALFGRHALAWEDRMPLDLWYVDHWSLRLDLKILIRTIPIVLSAENIYDPLGGSRMRATDSSIASSGVSETHL